MTDSQNANEATSGARELAADEVTLILDPTEFGFANTSELEPLSDLVGQPRAMRALDLGLGVRHRNFHIYAAGLTGTGRLQLIQDAIEQRTTDSKVPNDWVYVHNFRQTDQPTAISLPAGQGAELKTAMGKLIEHLCEALPVAFRQEDFGKEKEKLRMQYREKETQLMGELEKIAAQFDMAVQQNPNGEIFFIPMKDGRAMTPEEAEKISPERMKELESHQDELFRAASKTLNRQREMHRQLSDDVHEIARKFAAQLVDPLIGEIKTKFVSDERKQADLTDEHSVTSDLQTWSNDLRDHMLDHLDSFQEQTDEPHSMLDLLAAAQKDSEQRFLEYQVNVLVDNSDLKRAPIVVENSPNYRNLFGTIERMVDRSGRVITNYTRIKSGSMLRANGGFLVVDLMEALSEPLVWKHLKRTLKSGSLELEVYDPFSMFSVSGLKPGSIPLDVKIVAVGEPLTYHLLYLHDDDFREIFRVKADFDDELTRDEEAGRIYGGLARRLSDRENLRALDAGAVAVLVREGSRLASNRAKLSTLFSELADVIREADFWAGRDDADVVGAEHLELAIRERLSRSDLIAEKIRELIRDQTLLVDIEGTAVGQINGLSVANLGDHSFGRPSRLTASVGVGTGGVINIERESRLSGRTYDKGLLILEGYLRNQYATNQPLALSASIAMEQSYGGIDGDSATIAELLCLLSSLANVPVRQDIAITGSINQLGDIQAIGGVNEKIEGHFEVCSELGLTGTQGVCIPGANCRHLILRPHVAEAIRSGQFHVWAVNTVDEAIELMLDLKLSGIENAEGLHECVLGRFAGMLEILNEQQMGVSGHLIWTPGMPTELPPDPRPPFPHSTSELS